MSSRALLQGEPMELDVVYRPMAWALAVPPAAILGAVLFWLGYVYLAPLPPALAWLGHALFFWARGDRPCVLAVSDDALTLDDPRRGQRLTVSRTAVHAATLTLRKREGGGSTGILALWSTSRPLLAIRVALPATSPRAEEVDGDLISASIGGDGGTAYAFAPVSGVGRQLIRDPDGALIAWYRALPQPVRERTPVRCWRGLEPTLDLLGRHEEAWDAILLFDGESVTLDGHPVSSDGWQWGHADREANLLRVPDGSEGFASTRIELACLRFDAEQLVFPAGLAADLGEPQPLSADSLHTHNGEGAAGLYHLLRHHPRGAWPGPLRNALTDGRGFLGGKAGVVA